MAPKGFLGTLFRSKLAGYRAVGHHPAPCGQYWEVLTHYEATLRGFFEGGGSKKCVQTNFTLFLVIFWLFWCILCTLVHFCEKMDILEGRTRRRQMGNCEYPAPKRPRKHPSECTFVSPKLPAVEIWTHVRASEPSWCHGNCNCPFAGVPQNNHIFTKMHQSAQNTPK